LAITESRISFVSKSDAPSIMGDAKATDQTSSHINLLLAEVDGEVSRSGRRQRGAKKANEDRIDNDPKLIKKARQSRQRSELFSIQHMESNRGRLPASACVGQCSCERKLGEKRLKAQIVAIEDVQCLPLYMRLISAVKNRLTIRKASRIESEGGRSWRIACRGSASHFPSMISCASESV